MKICLFLVFALFLLLIIDINNQSTSAHTQKSKSRIQGKVVSVSDVLDQSDSPLIALIIVIKESEFKTLLKEVNEVSSLSDAYNQLNFSLTREVFNKYVIAHTISNKDGLYSLALPPGKYIVCLSNIYDQKQSIRSLIPAVIYGGDRIKISINERKHQNIYWSDGWMSLGPQ